MLRREFVNTTVTGMLLRRAGVARVRLFAEALSTQQTPRRVPFGAAVEPRWLKAEPDYRAAVIRYCDIITVNGSLHWRNVHPRPDQYDFRDADFELGFAELHAIKARGHALIWNQVLPDWLPDRLKQANPIAVMREHIQAVVSHFRGRLESWDVVNELLPEVIGGDPIRNSIWKQTVGPTFVEEAFRAARKADDASMLGYNENRLESDAAASDQRRRGALSILRDLVKKGVPIDYLGLQAHLNPSDTYSAEKLGTFVRQVEDLGIKVMVTELDVDDSALPSSQSTRDELVAQCCDRFLGVLFRAALPSAVITWGLTDRHTWRSTFSPRPDGLGVRPLPLDESMQPKAELSTIERYLRQGHD